MKYDYDAGFTPERPEGRELVEAWKDGPCALCMYRPPSSTDGKPCTMCPASRGGELTWK